MRRARDACKPQPTVVEEAVGEFEQHIHDMALHGEEDDIRNDDEAHQMREEAEVAAAAEDAEVGPHDDGPDDGCPPSELGGDGPPIDDAPALPTVASVERIWRGAGIDIKCPIAGTPKSHRAHHDVGQEYQHSVQGTRPWLQVQKGPGGPLDQ